MNHHDMWIRPMAGACLLLVLGLLSGCQEEGEAIDSGNNELLEELGNLGLTDQEVDDIVAFLKTLTDGYVLAEDATR